MAAISQTLKLAVKHLNTGHLRQAENLCRQILQTDAIHAEALHLLGVILSATGMNEEALRVYQDSLTLKPDYADALNNLDLILYAQDRIDESVISFEQAVGCNPDRYHFQREHG
jgi:Tfp pilus assembly protein PilF